jgi:hypothetical protein
MRDNIKKFAFEVEKLFDQKHVGEVSSSYSRKETRSKLSQFVVDNLFDLLSQQNQKKVLKEMGFGSMAFCAKKLGFSRQWIHKNQHLLQEKVFYNGKYYYKV